MTGFEEIYEYFFDHVPMYVAVISASKTLTIANKTLLDFSQQKLEDIIGTVYFELPWWQSSDEVLNQLFFAVEQAFMGEDTRFSAMHVDYNENLHEIDFHLRPIVKNGITKHVLAIGYDITELVSTRKSLTNKEKEIKAFFDSFRDGFFFLMLQDTIQIDGITDNLIQQIINQQTIKSINSVVADFTGCEFDSHLELFDFIGITAKKRVELWKKMLTQGRSESRSTVQNQVSGKNFNLSVTLNRIVDDEGDFEGCFVILRDVTREQEYINQLSYLAHKDYLTGLSNRRSVFEETSSLINSISDRSKSLFVAILDVDFFKSVNDNYGHDWGDIVLKRFATLIAEMVPKGAIAARYGGEEFVVVAESTQEKFIAMLEDVRKKTMELKFEHPSKVFSITVSGGFSVSSGKDINIDALLTAADKALYESKRNGRNRVTMFVEEYHGADSLDSLCNILKERSLMYKLERFFEENVQKNQDYFSIVHVNLRFLKSMDATMADRYLSTLSLCVTTALRKEDFVGRYGEYGIIAVLPMMLKKHVGEIVSLIKHNINIGFNFYLNDVVEIEMSVTDTKQDKLTFDSLLRSVERGKQILAY